MSGNYDVLVVGGGPAGATAAALLAEAGWKVALVEQKAFPRRKVCGEFISETTWPLLQRLGVADELRALAGPIVRRVGVFVEGATHTAALPGAKAVAGEGGRALGREYLDTVLLRHAATVGAEVLQPWTLAGFTDCGNHYQCQLAEKPGGRVRDCRATLIIAAHGSWEMGVLPTQTFHRRARASDLFGFKAHFKDSALPQDLMPLIAFPGGYGGMVHSDDGRMSLSCCVRRDTLEQCRKQSPGISAGEALQVHITTHCEGVAQALAQARRDGPWLAAGPLRTGIRSFGNGRIFAVGNAVAEAHPIVAEGISMAMQSAHLLCELLLCRKANATADAVLESILLDYEAAWRRNFSSRLHMAALYAHLFMRPRTARVASAAVRMAPELIAVGARLSGKAQPLRSSVRAR